MCFSHHQTTKAILHIDGDAFFASCEQSRNPALRGRPVITGKERGIASSMSYEAKARGITRGMSLWEIKKMCPDAVILPSDYETYSLLSCRLFSIVRRYTPDVEEYGIDECFADISGLRRTFRGSYTDIAAKIKSDLDKELGFTFSVGLAPTKVLAKVGSKWKKPSGLTVIHLSDIHNFIDKLPTEKIWGIGPRTAAFLEKQRIYTAGEFARCDEGWIKSKLSKPFYEIWEELNGESVLPLALKEKTSYSSIQKVKTFTPPSSDYNFVFSQLSKNIENACIKARRYYLAAPGAVFFLRTQEFKDYGMEIKLNRPTNLPEEILKCVRPCFDKLFSSLARYRSTGIILFNLVPAVLQPDLFRETAHAEKLIKLYAGADKISAKYGKHTLFLGSSFLAEKFGAHEGDRGDAPERKKAGIFGETKRQRLNIPMLMGGVI